MICVKFKSSRNFSIEVFVVCEGYSFFEGFDYKDLYKFLERVSSRLVDMDCFSVWFEGFSKFIVFFLVCGDLSGYDVD